MPKCPLMTRVGSNDASVPMGLVLATFLASALFASSQSASAQQCDPVETYKLLASDGAARDWFGYSVAINGSTAIVGARWDDDNGTWSGSVFLFDNTSGQQLFKLLPDDGAAFDFFGTSVTISDTTAIVGATGDDDNGEDSGSAYLFDTADPTNPVQLFKLLPTDGAAGDGCGRSVAISGTTAIVGVSGDDDNGEDSGSAYLFDTTTGRQIAKILADDGAENDHFGWAVAINGTTAIIGAYGDDDNGNLSGSAYLFDISDPANPMQIAKLLPRDGAPKDVFGHSLAINRTTVIVGAWGDDDNGENSGSAYLVDISDPANPTQIAKLLPNDGAEGDIFGKSVAISGATALVGAYHNGDNGRLSGSAYLFDTTTGRQIAKLIASDAAGGDEFGQAVAIRGATAIIGALVDSNSNGEDAGSAYLFDVNCGPSLRIAGSCPGRMGFQATSVTPGGQVAFLNAPSPGFFTIPTGNPCAGTMLGLNRNVKLATVVRADANGVATVIVNIPSQACGKIFVQVLDVSTCQTSNVAGL